MAMSQTNNHYSNKTMTQTNTSHCLRKRSWGFVPIFLTAGIILSLQVSSSNKDSLARQRDEYASLSSSSSRGDDGQRRFLLLDEDQVIEVDLVDGADKENRNNAWLSRLMAKVAERDATAMEDRPSTRQMIVIPRYEDKHHFEECIGKSIEQCQTLIDTFVTSNPEQFNNQTTLRMDIRKIREITDESYYKVVLRTNMTGDEVYGILDDGQVFYPWPWTVHTKDLTIGPWDCAGLTPAKCCQLIQEDMPNPDDIGNFLACFVEEPVGSEKNPEKDDRAITVVDADIVIVRAPIAH